MKGSLFYFVFLLSFGLPSVLWAQGPFGQVYTLFQAKCNSTSCHSSAGQAGGLDLDGGGNWQTVYNNLINAHPNNQKAKDNGHRLVFPGDPYRSFLFRKCNGGLDPASQLTTGEGAEMPQSGTLTDVERETIRQWIVWGAKDNGNLIDVAQITDYYNGNGINSMPAPPPAPPAGQGFQIHIGPFFLSPNEEKEYNAKYELLNAQAGEMTRTDCFFGPGYCHHFTFFLVTNLAEQVPPGLRDFSPPYSFNIVAALQHSDSLKYPPFTAMPFDANATYDVNSHYINASPKILACHNYVNVYTQPEGEALAVLKTAAINHFQEQPFYPSPQLQTIQSEYFLPTDSTIYIWSAVSHAHKRSKGFKTWFRNPDGTSGEPFYNASHINGDPNNSYIGYDFAHPPIRLFVPFLEMNLKNGFFMEAQYNIPEPDTVYWGQYGNDEMMLMIFQYTDIDVSKITETTKLQENETPMLLYPNPMAAGSDLILKTDRTDFQVEIFDALGRKVLETNSKEFSGNTKYVLPTASLSPGVYHCLIKEGNKVLGRSKLAIR